MVVACLVFRVFSKEINGTEDNDRSVRLALVNFVTQNDNACHFSKRVDGSSSRLYDPIKSMQDYIRQKKMDQNGWETDCELNALATMLQVCVYRIISIKRPP